MDCLRQSEFSGMDGETVQEVHAMAHLTNSNSFSLQDAQYAVRVPRHFWQVNYLACAWATVVAFALHVFAITFKINKDETKINTSRKMALLTSVNDCSLTAIISVREITWNYNTQA